MTRPFSLGIEADEDLLRRLPPQWESYLSPEESACTRVLLRVKKNEALDELRCADGWSLCGIDGLKQAVFASQGKPLFTLDYSKVPQEAAVSVRRALSPFVRTGVLYGLLTALHQSCVGLHGVTLQCGGQTVILSAPSGTGKTTLSRLLEEHAGARVINGDFALLSISEEGVMFEPTPFCGTSGICRNERLKVDRIVFLSQSPVNRWQELNGRQAGLCLANNTFQAMFDSRLQQHILSNAMRILSLVRASAFAFAPVKEAAQLFHHQLINE